MDPSPWKPCLGGMGALAKGIQIGRCLHDKAPFISNEDVTTELKSLEIAN